MKALRFVAACFSSRFGNRMLCGIMKLKVFLVLCFFPLFVSFFSDPRLGS